MWCPEASSGGVEYSSCFLFLVVAVRDSYWVTGWLALLKLADPVPADACGVVRVLAIDACQRAPLLP